VPQDSHCLSQIIVLPAKREQRAAQHGGESVNQLLHPNSRFYLIHCFATRSAINTRHLIPELPRTESGNRPLVF
jgi:hypothetical protein